jgi:hypothetical protein
MRIYFTIIAFVLGTLISSESASAQRVDDLSRGEKVRLLMRGGTTTRGYIDTVTTDAISLHIFTQNPDGDRLLGRRDLVTQMQVFRKKPGKGVARGALYGLAIGAGTMFLVGALTYSDSDCDILACSPASAGGFASIWGAVIGVPVGMMWGASRQEWRDVALRPK